MQVKDQAGFIVNALLFPYLNNAIRMLEGGVATSDDIDEAMKGGCNFPMGPLALLDLVGLDTQLARSSTRCTTSSSDPNYAAAAALRRMVSAGRLGRKSGRGLLLVLIPRPAPVVGQTGVVIRVVLAEDNALLREGLVNLIALQKDLEVVGAAADYDALIELVEAAAPDVVVTDIRMPPTGTDEGIRAAIHLGELNPAIGVVVLSQFASPAYAVALLEKGSAGRAYLLKERVSDVGQLVNAIREVANGGSVIDPEVVEALVDGRASPTTAASDG